MAILMEIGELQDISEKDPLHWVHILVFGLVVIVVLFMMRQRPRSIFREDPNNVKIQVVETRI